MKLLCLIFGCAYDPVDESSPFECFRCGAEVEGAGWYKGLRIFRKLLRWRNGWPWKEA